MDEESRRQAKIEEETSYELMLKQQQLFLQWQLEMQSKVSSYRKDTKPLYHSLYIVGCRGVDSYGG